MKHLHITVFVATLALCIGHSLQQGPCEEQPDTSNFALIVSTAFQTGQWFTADCAGPLGNFVFLFQNPHTGGTAQLEARLYPGNNWPANAGADAGLGVVTATVNNGATSVTFNFAPTGASLIQGVEYAIRLVALSGSVFIGGLNQNPNGPYPGGQLLSALNTAGAGGSIPSHDLAFRYFPPGAAVPPAVAQGDPHLVGLQGQHYDFNGRGNTVFNLLTSPLLQVNALFTDMEVGHGFLVGTYLQSISIQAHNDVLPQPILIDAGNSSFVDHPRLRFGVGENAVEFEATRPNNNGTRQRENVLLKTQATEVTWTATETTTTALGIADTHDDRVVRVATVSIANVAVIEVFCVENGYGMHHGRLQQHTPTARRSLDVRMRLLNNNMKVHGVIGATNDATVARPPGKDEEYAVKDGLLGTDFVYNLYPRNNNNINN